jgi:hypothetical protein
MAKTSFVKKAEVVESTPESVTDTTVAVAQPKTLAVQHEGKDDMFGEWLPGDSKLPRLNIRQKSSGDELQENFEFGDLVFAKKIKLADENSTVTVVPIIAGKDYQQKVPFGEGQGVVYPTAQAVIDNGGVLQYSKEAVNEQTYFGPRAHIELAIKAPKGLSEDDLNYFPFEFNGESWAVCLFTVASSAYTSFAKELETLRRHNVIMRKGLIYGQLELTTKQRNKPGQSWFIPVAKLVGENPPELVEFLEKIK